MHIKIDNLGAHGEGVGTLPDGMRIFVDGALPGETIEVELTTRKKSYAKGRLTKLIVSSDKRVMPICPLFGECGGCHLMHLDYSAQLEAKRQRVSDALTRLGHQSVVVSECIPSPMPLHYRNKIQLPVQNETIGLFKKRSHDIVDVKTCYIHNKPGDEIYRWIRDHLPHRVAMRHLLIRTAVHTDETLVVLVTNGSADFSTFAQLVMEKWPRVVGVVENINRAQTNTILGRNSRTLAGRDHLIEQLLDKQFKISPLSFFQVNT